MTTQAFQAPQPTAARSAVLGAVISLVTLIGGLLLGLVLGTLGHGMLPGATFDILPLIGGIIPALTCFMLGSGLWGVGMGRLAGSRETKRLALAGLLGFAPITIVLALLMQAVEQVAINSLDGAIPIHRWFTIFFVPTVFVISAVCGWALGIGLRDRALAKTLA